VAATTGTIRVTYLAVSSVEIRAGDAQLSLLGGCEECSLESARCLREGYFGLVCRPNHSDESGTQIKNERVANSELGDVLVAEPADRHRLIPDGEFGHPHASDIVQLAGQFPLVDFELLDDRRDRRRCPPPDPLFSWSR